MKWSLKFLLFCGFLALVVGCGSKKESNIDYIARITSIQLPSDTKVLAVYDNAETFLVMALEIPSTATHQFINDAKLSPGAGIAELPVYSRALPEKYRMPPARAQLLSTSGRSPKNTWEFVFDPSTCRLWSLVRYPDWSGDTP